MTKMLIDRAVVEQALEAIESDTVLFSAWTEKMLAARTALKAALAEPVQEQCKGDPGECEFNGGCMYACAPQRPAEPDTDCHAQGICQRTGYSIK